MISIVQSETLPVSLEVYADIPPSACSCKTADEFRENQLALAVVCKAEGCSKSRRIFG